MTVENPDQAEDEISLQGMRSVLAAETSNLTKIAQLRIRELTQIVEAYAAGQTSPGETNERFAAYVEKWGDSLPHHLDSIAGLTDEQISERVNDAQAARASHAQKRRSASAPDRTR